MKYAKLLCLILAALFLIGCASMKPLTDEERTFERVVQAPGYSKEQIYDGTKIWIAENFRSSKAVLEYENKEAGTVIGNGVIPYPCKGIEYLDKGDWTVSFTMRADIKDQRFRLTFSNLNVAWPASYNKTAGLRPGHDGPIRNQGDLMSIRPVLLKYGDEILSSFGKGKSKANW